MSRQRALANLSGNISTSISQQVTDQIRENSATQVSEQNREIRTKAITENSIENSQRDAIWLDRQGCRLWVRMKVAKKDVEAIQYRNLNQFRLEQARNSYLQADNATLAYPARQAHIEDAISQVEKTDFSVLPREDRETYINKYRKLQSQIEAETGRNEILVFTMADQDLPKSIHKELAWRISQGLNNSRHIYPAPCTRLDDCVKYAHGMGARRLITVSVRTTTTSGQMGSRLGELSVDASLYDVDSGRLLNQTLNQKGRVLSFDQDHIAWEQAIGRLFADSDPIKELNKTAYVCSTRKC